MGLLKKSSHKASQVKQVCVTGASGFVGKNLVDKLLSEGFLVRVLTHNSKRSFPEGVEIFYADLESSICNLKDFFSGCDIFFHCAGNVNMLTRMHALHVDGIERLLKAFCDEIDLSGHSMHWVQLSSVGVYGKSNHPAAVRKISELSKMRPFGEYEITKAKADKLLLDAAKSGKFAFTILRPSNIVGLGMSNQSFKGLVENIIKQRFFYIGSMHSVSNYVHIDDVVSALIICSSSPKAINQIFNLSNDCKLSDIVLRLTIAEKLQHKNLVVPEWLVRFMVSLIPNFFNFPLTQGRIDALTSKTYYANSKIERFLRFSPKKPIPESLQLST